MNQHEHLAADWCGWAVKSTNETFDQYQELIEKWEFSKALGLVEHFFRDQVCSWFLEATKFFDASDMVKEDLNYCVKAVLVMLYPFAPVFANRTHQELFDEEVQRFETRERAGDWEKVLKQQSIITKARSVSKITTDVEFSAEADVPFLKAFSRLNFVEELAGTHFRYSFLQLAVDDGVERLQNKLAEEIEEHKQILGTAQQRLNNENFVAKAPEELIDEMQQRIEGNKREIKEKAALLGALGG